MDEDDILDEAVELVPGDIPSLSDQIFGQMMLSNVQDLGKVTFAYLYNDGEIPLAYRALSQMEEFSDNFEFLALSTPSDMTLNSF